MTITPLRLSALALCVVALTACPQKPPSTTDETPPEVVSLSPEDGASDVAIATRISVQFSEAVRADSVKLGLRAHDASADLEGTLLVEGERAHFTPAQPLEEGVRYTVTLAKGFADLAGNAWRGAPITWDFTTLVGALQVAQTDPADGAQNVPVDAPVSARFNAPLNAESVNAQTFYLRDGSNAVSGQTRWDEGEKRAVFTPSGPLLEGRSYSATLTSDILGIDGEHLAQAKTWTFTTAATVPTVVSVEPGDGAVAVAGNTPVRVVFSEGMDPGTLTPDAFSVSVMGGEAVPGTRSWDAPTRTATFRPSGAYPGGAVVEVHLSQAVKDLSGIGLGADVSASFTVSNAPAVAASSPVADEVGVALGASVELQFTQPMDLSTLTQANVRLEDADGAPVAGTWIPTATTLSIVPQAAFTESSLYSVVVTTAVRSAAGVSFDAEYRFVFTTLGVPPQVVSVTPAHEAGDVPVTAQVELRFNEDMDAATFTAANLRLSDGAADVTGTVSTVDARTARFTPALPLRETAGYTVIAGLGLKDARGNALASEFRAHFRTEPLPRIVSVLPAPNAQNVAPGAAIVLVANKALDAATVTLTPSTGTPKGTLTLYQEDQVIEGAVTYEPATRSIRVRRMQNGAPAAWTANTRYLLVVDGALLRDTSGNAVGGRFTTTFVAGAIADASAPQVTAISPVSGQTGASRITRPFVQFNEPIDPTTLSAQNLHLRQAGTNIPGRIEWVPADLRVVFVPDARLPGNAQLTFTVGAGIADTSGNVRTQTNSVGFTTQANGAAQLVSSHPVQGAQNVPVNGAVRLVFSEPVEVTTLDVEVTSGANADPVPGSLTYDEASASALYRPASALPSGEDITVTVKAGLQDKEGLATTDDVVRAFTTVANGSHDIAPPLVSASQPANGATGISSRPLIQLTFSEALDASTVGPERFTLERSGGDPVPFGLSFDAQTDTVTLTPSVALAPGATYQVRVGAGLKDLAGNEADPSAASSTVSFTVDGAAPTVTLRSPSANSTVGVGSGVELTFSEPMNAETLDAASFTLTQGGTPVLAAVWYEQGTRTLFLRPAARLQAGTHSATLDGTRASDLAGNLVGDSFNFTVSTSGPSVDAVSPCGLVIDPAHFGSTVVSVQFDVGVRKTGGGALDGTALQLRANNIPVTGTVTHTAGGASATFTPAAPLQHDTLYTVNVVHTQVQNATTQAPMTSAYACTFRTKRIVFEDGMDPMPQSGWTNVSVGQNQWRVANGNDDPQNATQAWRGGHNSGGGNYTRVCSAFGGTAQEVRLERTLNLAGLTAAELRLDTWHRLAASDSARIEVVAGNTSQALEAPVTGNTQSAYTARTYDLSQWVNQTVTLRFTLNIAGGTQNLLTSCPGTDLGFFVDNVRVVGE